MKGIHSGTVQRRNCTHTEYHTLRKILHHNVFNGTGSTEEERRTVANEACDAGRVLVNGKSAKASLNVKEGDVIEIEFGTRTVKVEVLDVQETVRKDEAKELYKYL